MKAYKQSLPLSRREFGALSVKLPAFMAMLLPKVEGAVAVTESDVNIKTPDGTADCYFVQSPHPEQAPASSFGSDNLLGLRPAFRTMGKRLAESGYSVLVVNPFYRSKKAPVINADGAKFSDPAVRCCG